MSLRAIDLSYFSMKLMQYHLSTLFSAFSASLYYGCDNLCLLSCRYLYIRWGVELSNMTVVVGESGDTDYEGLLGGVHKTIILKGSFNAVPNQVHAARSYSLQDVISFDKPGITSIEGYGPDNLKSALQQFGILKDNV